MPRNGSGTFSFNASTWSPAVDGVTATSADWNTNVKDDIATALTNSVSKDGQTAMTGNLPMGGNRLTNVGAAVAITDSARPGEIQSGAWTYLTGVAGADTITASLTGFTAYAAGNSFRFVAAGANTGAVTLNINATGAKAVTKNGTTALAAGDIPNGAIVEVAYDGTRFQLLNVALTTPISVANGGTGGTSAVTARANLEVEPALFPIAASVAANALTLTLNPCLINFRSTTLNTGTSTAVNVAAAITLTISSGSTLGTVNTVANRVALIAINNAGTVELAAVNMAGGTNLDETTLISTTAEGGAGGADSATTIYSTTARASVAFRVVGYVESTQATAGTWATSPSLVQGKGGAAIAALQSFGNGQTWQTVTGSRSLGTTYYNTTGRPIMLAVYGTASGGNNTINISINGGAAFPFAGIGAITGVVIGTVIVPAGASYAVTVSAAITVTAWSELR